MFDQPPSLPMRAAIASFLGGLFGVALILFSHGANAQAVPVDSVAQTAPASDASTSIRRLGEAALRSLRGTEPALDGGVPGARGLRINDSGNEAGAGLRWQMAPRRVLRSEVENPRSGDQINLGLQLRF